MNCRTSRVWRDQLSTRHDLAAANVTHRAHMACLSVCLISSIKLVKNSNSYKVSQNTWKGGLRTEQNWMCCSGSGDSLQYKLKQGVLPSCESHYNVNSKQQQHAIDRRNWGFWRLIAWTVCTPPKLTYNWHIGGMLLKMIPITVNCTVWDVPTQAPLKITPFLPVLGAWKTAYTEIPKFFNGVCIRTPIHVFCFKNGRNWSRISGWKAALHWWHKKQNAFWHP